MWTCSLFLSILLIIHSFILSPWIPQLSTERPRGQFANGAKPTCANPARCWSPVWEQAASVLITYYLALGFPWVTWGTPVAVAVLMWGCVGVHLWSFLGSRSHAEAHQSDALRVWNWCLCCRPWGTAQELAGTNAAGVVQEGCVCWRETDVGLLCPL